MQMAAEQEASTIKLDYDTVRNLCGEASTNIGEAYLHAKQVVSVRKDAVNGAYLGVVKDGRTRYEVEFVVVGYSTDMPVVASCPCRDYTPRKYCKHIAAVLLSFVNSTHENQVEPLPIFTEQDISLTQKAIRLFDRAPAGASEPVTQKLLVGDSESLQVEYTCKVLKTYNADPMIGISLKVGLSRLYVVQRLKEFLYNVEAGTPMVFAKHFTFDPSEQVFLPADEQMLGLLIRALRAEEVYQEFFYSFYTYSQREERMLMIPPAIWKEMEPLIDQVNMKFDQGSGQMYRLELIDGMLPIQAGLHKAGEQGYLLRIDGIKQAVLLPKYGYAFVNGMLYKQESQHLSWLSEVKRMFEHKPDSSFKITGTQIGSFLDRVVRGLQRIMSVEISPEIADQIVNPPLLAKLHLDYVDQRLEAKLTYHYGDIVITPLPEADSSDTREDVILMRDVERENRIMQQIERASFKFNGIAVYVDHEDDIYDFLFGILPELYKDVEIYATDAVNQLMRTNDYEPRARLEVDPGTNWLEVSFDLDGMDEANLQQMLGNLVEKKKYFRTTDGAFVSLEQDGFQHLTMLIEELEINKMSLGGKSFRLPAVRSFALMDQFNKVTGVQVGKSLRKLWDDLRNPDNLEFDIPDQLGGKLRDYQKYGYQWLRTLAHYGLGGILADDMGLGKTIQSIAFITAQCEEAGASVSVNSSASQGTLIVSPASLIYNWEGEFKRFAPHLRVVVAAGDRQERSELMSGSESADVWITSYPLLRRDVEWYEKMTFRTIFLDEAQAIKNHASLTAIAVRRLKAEQRFALTGTPIENSLEELRSIFEAVFPGLFSGRKAFSELPREKIARIVKPFILRRLKKEVLKELPDKIESVQPSELTVEQKVLYMAYLEKLQNDVASNLADEGFQKSRMKILAGLTRLRQLCCHPSLFIEGYDGASGKLEQLLELIEECMASGKRMLIFSQFTSMLALIRRQLEERELEYFYLDGTTPSIQRVELCRKFNEGERNLFLISLKAGGTGLNLTGADTVVLFDLWWNPAVEQQAADRAHRIGQKNVVQVIRLVAKGTIEEKMLELQQRKKHLIEEVIQAGDSELSSLTEEDIRLLLDL